MRLHRLVVTGFGPFGGTQEIDFDALSSAGLFLLHGPTGAGKTSVLDAVCYALYGAVPGARQSPGTSLRSDHTPPGTYTEVLLELTVGERRLEITRRPAQQRPKKRGGGFTTEKAQSWLREYDAGTGAWQGLSRSHQEIGEEITQLLGMSREQFCQVVLLPQGDFARFLRADAEARGKLLGRLFDTRRFAAVEDRLAELRRAAEQQVREGDERLLALAQRMAEAAGGGAVEERPGEPGLAEAVQVRAAVARSEAREALDVADLGLAAAESRQAAARRRLDEERELAALQQRHAEALRRRAELDARRGERDAWQATLDRARKADLVAPALDLRDEAERAHATAASVRERTRSELHPDLVDEGAERLSRLEAELRERLGGLDAARRAERRSAEIGEELAVLDRQARADDETLQDANAWLADWETRRTVLQDRVDAAQEATTRAEHLAGRLEPARRRLEAACRRDELAKRVTEGASLLTAAREARNTAKETWLDVKSRRLQGIAAELAAALTDEAPCQVCGSMVHPAPARTEAGHVDRATEDAAYEAFTKAEQSHATAERDLAVTRESWATARAEVLTGHGPAAAGRTIPSQGTGAEPTAAGTDRTADVPVGVAACSSGLHGRPAAVALDAGWVDVSSTLADPTVVELDDEVRQLEREYADARALAAETHARREALARGERESEERVAARQEAERRVAARTSRREALDGQRASLDAEAARGRGEAASVAEHATLLERRIAILVAAAESVRAVEVTAERLKEADDRLADAAFRAGFDTPAAAAAALVDDGRRRELQHRLDAWQAEDAAVADRLRDPETRAAADRPPADPANAETSHTAAERALRVADSALAAVRDRCAALDRLSRQADDEVRRLGPLREEYDRVARLAGLTAGTSADNERKMRLESYVLAARLEQVAAAATARLQRMSSGRYTLVHSDARSGGKRAGLGLHVVDAWTGNERDTATLSGGETFFASLALALGLADVVTDEAGGVRLDTLFIDEGFGSLDDQTLDEVLDVLDSLRERDRSVGIVSHVPDLRRRIPAQLEVVKERHGSAVRLRVSG
ncbi:SMC family ATPase [Streptomyces solicathayae]|uniref:Nuclease SbcCD subunit C n=1 Tax=Streptomyces solicathayae TaxID=3081768 RepID=A0ABZ0M2L4_9ACTN|nr:SMC family ATPase [Streptomyces sp. HUAS YS2]WOX25671.1 SMC family ATPase [Streptomyces sp. HUAS YS2]